MYKRIVYILTIITFSFSLTLSPLAMAQPSVADHIARRNRAALLEDLYTSREILRTLSYDLRRMEQKVVGTLTDKEFARGMKYLNRIVAGGTALLLLAGLRYRNAGTGWRADLAGYGTIGGFYAVFVTNIFSVLNAWGPTHINQKELDVQLNAAVESLQKLKSQATEDKQNTIDLLIEKIKNIDAEATPQVRAEQKKEILVLAGVIFSVAGFTTLYSTTKESGFRNYVILNSISGLLHSASTFSNEDKTQIKVALAEAIASVDAAEGEFK